MRKVVLSVIATLLCLGSGISHPKRPAVSPEWEKMDTSEERMLIWKKEIPRSLKQRRAILIIISERRETTYGLIRPCKNNAGTYTLTWTNESLLAEGFNCYDIPVAEPIPPLRELFLPIPKEAYDA